MDVVELHDSSELAEYQLKSLEGGNFCGRLWPWCIACVGKRYPVLADGDGGVVVDFGWKNGKDKSEYVCCL